MHVRLPAGRVHGMSTSPSSGHEEPNQELDLPGYNRPNEDLNQGEHSEPNRQFNPSGHGESSQRLGHSGHNEPGQQLNRGEATPARQAATVILLRGGGNALEVLL